MLLFTPAQRTAIVANRRAHGLLHANMASSGVAELIGNASPLPKDVWGEWDSEGVAIQREVLSVFNDLAASTQTALPIGKVVHYFQTISDSGEINVSMDGRGKARGDQPELDYHGTPVPIIDSSYSFGWRQVAAATSEGLSLDPAARANSNRRVAEALEMAALDGYGTIKVSGAQSYGLRTHPNRNTRSTGATLNGGTGVEWLAEIVATLNLLQADNYFAPATLYLNWSDWFYASVTDYSTGYPKTILQRLQEVAGIASIVPAARVNADEILAVVKRPDVVRVLNAMPMVTRALFRANPEDDYDFNVMAAAAVEIKFDADDNCGVAHSS